MIQEFFLNGKRLENFKPCDFFFFTNDYESADIVIQKENYAKVIFHGGEMDDVWEIKEYKEGINA